MMHGFASSVSVTLTQAMHTAAGRSQNLAQPLKRQMQCYAEGAYEEVQKQEKQRSSRSCIS